MKSLTGASSYTVASRLQIKDLKKRVSFLLLIILGMAEFVASSQLSGLTIFNLLRSIKICSCDAAFALVEIFKERSEKTKQNQSFVSIFRIAECPVLCEIRTKQENQVARTALSAHLVKEINYLFDHIFHHVFVDFCSSVTYIDAALYL